MPLTVSFMPSLYSVPRGSGRLWRRGGRRPPMDRSIRGGAAPQGRPGLLRRLPRYPRLQREPREGRPVVTGAHDGAAPESIAASDGHSASDVAREYRDCVLGQWLEALAMRPREPYTPLSHTAGACTTLERRFERVEAERLPGRWRCKVDVWREADGSRAAW